MKWFGVLFLSLIASACADNTVLEKLTRVETKLGQVETKLVEQAKLLAERPACEVPKRCVVNSKTLKSKEGAWVGEILCMDGVPFAEDAEIGWPKEEPAKKSESSAPTPTKEKKQ